MHVGKSDENKTLGPDYDFFETYLLSYYDGSSTDEIILDNESDISKKFCDLLSLYEITKSEDPFNKDKPEEEADSLAFYISIGLIVKDEKGSFKINATKLNKTAESFQAVLEEAKTYSLGAM